jgi:hypothetical protein
MSPLSLGKLRVDGRACRQGITLTDHQLELANGRQSAVLPLELVIGIPAARKPRRSRPIAIAVSRHPVRAADPEHNVGQIV